MTGHVRYGQFCPVAMAAEILCSRWTIPILREMLCGSTRFNELRKGVPRPSNFRAALISVSPVSLRLPR